MTRQLQRQLCRAEAWQRWQVTPDSAPKDDSGVMTRRRRRSISLAIARQAFKKISDAARAGNGQVQNHPA